MLEKVNRYLSYQGEKYIKPEKAGPLTDEMLTLKALAQSARKEFSQVAQKFSDLVTPFSPERVSQWMNQAQVCRPHFWSYYRLPSDSLEDVALALRLYGEPDNFGISVEVSFIERKKSDKTLTKQAKVLDLPIDEPLYYWVQEEKGSDSYRLSGSEENRLYLKEALENHKVRKVLVKTDVLVTPDLSEEALLEKLLEGFQALLPYYQAAKK